MKLSELKIGESSVIKTVGGEHSLRCRLLDMGLIPGTRVTLCKVAPMGDPLELSLRGYQLSIRKEDADKIELTGGERV